MEVIWEGVGVRGLVVMNILFHCFHMMSQPYGVNRTFVDFWGGGEVFMEVLVLSTIKAGFCF